MGLASIGVHAESWFQFEAGIGANTYQTMGDGTWYQEGAPYSKLRLTFPAVEVGARFNVVQRESWGVALHMDYVFLGRVASDCWCTPVDALYNTQTKQIAPSAIPLARYTGSGNAQGIALTVEPYLKRGAWRFGVEGGLFPYRPQWDETVSNWATTPGATPITIHAHTSNALRLGAVVGISVERGSFGMSLRHYFLQPFGAIGG